jgi:hypothetical protein
VKTVRSPGRLLVIATMACSRAPAAVVPSTPVAAKIALAVLPADSDGFPGAARAVTAQLAAARFAGVDAIRVAKASLEVVQLSIECVDPSDACYVAVGRSLAANRLLFARIEAGANRRQLKVQVTLYDVDAKAIARVAEQLYATEDAATTGAAALVAEVTR